MFKLFMKACYAFDEYYELMKTSWLKIIAYFFIVNFVTFMLYVPNIYSLVKDSIPEFTVSDGVFSTDFKTDTDLAQDIIEKTEQNNASLFGESKAETGQQKFKCLVDTDKDFTNEDLSDTSTGIAIDSHKIITKNYGMVQQMPVEELEKMGIVNKSTAVYAIMCTFLFVGIFLYYFSAVFRVLFYVVITVFLSFFLRNIVSYFRAVKITILSLTFPEILRAVLMLFSIRMHDIVYFAMMFAYLYFILKSIKKAEDDKKVIY